MQLPERFMQQPRTETLHNYITRKYSKYGYSREHKQIGYNPEFIPEYDKRSSNPDRYRWIENVSDGLRKTGDAHNLVRLNHTGWHVDEFQDETVHGEVYQLPTRHGVEQYIPAVSDPYNDDCACLDFTSIADNKEDAARWADNMAESWAEHEREYQAAESAKQRLEEIEDEIKAEYSDFRRIARELRANCDKLTGITVIRELVRDRWNDTKATIRQLRREQHNIKTNGLEY